MSEFSYDHDTIVPAGVDLTLARARNQLFVAYRSGEADGPQTYRNLLQLYWQSEAKEVNDETLTYLMDTTFDIGKEAEVDLELCDLIYEEELPKE